MNKVKVTVIIPVYNVETYLKKCMDSVTNQTLKDIQIICVNDGSTDRSPQILKEYANKDPRIEIINKKNAGLGAARNTCMEYAKGEYVGFVDSDDWIDLDMYEKLYENATINDSDIVMSPVHIFDEAESELRYDSPYFTLKDLDSYFDKKTFNHLETKKFMFKICVTAVNKLYNLKFLKKINVNFPEGLIFEDTPFFFETFLQANKVSIINDYLYFYRVNRPDSIIKKADKKYFDLLKIHEMTIDIFVKTNNYTKYEIDLINYILNNIFSRFWQVNENYRNEFFLIIKKYLEKLEFEKCDLNDLNPHSKNIYEDFMICDSYGDYKFLKLFDKYEKLQKENDQLKNSNNSFKQEINSCKNKIIEMESSNSWKITKPLRKIVSILRKYK
jgi:glycosyltransferase involved in cell wall biosynthesis